MCSRGQGRPRGLHLCIIQLKRASWFHLYQRLVFKYIRYDKKQQSLSQSFWRERVRRFFEIFCGGLT